MNSVVMLLISALGGVLIGQAGSIINSLITKKYEYKREMRKLTMIMGMEQQKNCRRCYS